MVDFKHQTFDIIRQLTGHENIITLNVAFVDFVGDLECGLFLSQLIYWSDRGTRKDGFVFKSDKEWYEELRLSSYAVRKSRKKLIEMGLLETKVKKANGNPTTHYKLNKEAFEQQFTSFLRNRNNEIVKSEKGNDENENSLTDITPYITSDHKGAKEFARSLSFLEYKNEFSIREDAIEAIEHYLSLYRQYVGKEHPRLKEAQWDRVVEDLFYVVNEDTGQGFDLDLDLDDSILMDMMDQHFNTTYKNCDYNILHFMIDSIRIRRMYEVASY